MSRLSINVQLKPAGKRVLLTSFATVILLSTAIGQHSSYDSPVDSTMSEQTTQTVYCTDGWFSRDKEYHFMAGFIGTTAISGTVSNSFDSPRHKSAEIASSGMIAVGALKETYDSRQPNNHFWGGEL